MPNGPVHVTDQSPCTCLRSLALLLGLQTKMDQSPRLHVNRTVSSMKKIKTFLLNMLAFLLLITTYDLSLLLFAIRKVYPMHLSKTTPPPHGLGPLLCMVFFFFARNCCSQRLCIICQLVSPASDHCHVQLDTHLNKGSCLRPFCFEAMCTRE